MNNTANSVFYENEKVSPSESADILDQISKLDKKSISGKEQAMEVLDALSFEHDTWSAIAELQAITKDSVPYPFKESFDDYLVDLDPDEAPAVAEKMHTWLLELHSSGMKKQEENIKNEIAINERFDIFEYTLSEHWLSPLINGDISGLEDEEIPLFEKWLESQPSGTWEVSDFSENYKKDEISGLQSKTVEVFLYVDKNKQEENLGSHSIPSTLSQNKVEESQELSSKKTIS